MIYEFDGKTEREAINNAIDELGLEADEFDVEIIEIQKNSLFKKGFAKIRVHVDEKHSIHKLPKAQPVASDNKRSGAMTPQNIESFITAVISGMGYSAEVKIVSKEERKILVRLTSEDSAIIIGKKGKNLDALQLIVNVYARKGGGYERVILDCENYRIRREESLVRLAYTTADQVVMNKQSVLLEPMNPYERRLIHSTLSDIRDVDTKSEGDGLFKQVRILYKGI